MGAGGAFSAARWLVTLLGAANIALSARVAHRAGGPVAAIVAASSYAILPEIVLHERSTYLEPLLNLSCLLLASTWLSRPVEHGARRSFAAGLCLGFGVSVKAWALLWALACLLWPNGADAATVRSSRRSAGWGASLRWLTAGTALAVLAINLPFLIAAPRSFLSQTVWFQFTRPADGMAIGFERAGAIFEGSWPVVLLALVGLAGFPLAAPRRGAFEQRAVLRRGVDLDHHRIPGVAHLLAALQRAPGSGGDSPAGLGGATLWAIGSRRRGARLATLALCSPRCSPPRSERRWSTHACEAISWSARRAGPVDSRWSVLPGVRTGVGAGRRSPALGSLRPTAGGRRLRHHADGGAEDAGKRSLAKRCAAAGRRRGSASFSPDATSFRSAIEASASSPRTLGDGSRGAGNNCRQSKAPAPICGDCGNEPGASITTVLARLRRRLRRRGRLAAARLAGARRGDCMGVGRLRRRRYFTASALLGVASCRIATSCWCIRRACCCSARSRGW